MDKPRDVALRKLFLHALLEAADRDHVAIGLQQFFAAQLHGTLPTILHPVRRFCTLGAGLTMFRLQRWLCRISLRMTCGNPRHRCRRRTAAAAVLAVHGKGAFLSSYARTLSNGALRFHTDRCDVVALFCVRQAARGGLSQLCSSPAVHNAMLERRPDLCAALYEDLWRSRFGEEDATNKSAYPLPVWGVRDGKFTSHYSRTYVEAAQRRPESEVPRVSNRQWQALDLLAEIAEEQC